MSQHVSPCSRMAEGGMASARAQCMSSGGAWVCEVPGSGMARWGWPGRERGAFARVRGGEPRAWLHLRGQDFSAHVRWEGSRVSERVCTAHEGWPVLEDGQWGRPARGRSA